VEVSAAWVSVKMLSNIMNSENIMDRVKKIS
jgi:hypothetical protein